jgi:hypothetical protein
LTMFALTRHDMNGSYYATFLGSLAQNTHFSHSGHSWKIIN